MAAGKVVRVAKNTNPILSNVFLFLNGFLSLVLTALGLFWPIEQAVLVCMLIVSAKIKLDILFHTQLGSKRFISFQLYSDVFLPSEHLGLVAVAMHSAIISMSTQV